LQFELLVTEFQPHSVEIHAVAGQAATKYHEVYDNWLKSSKWELINKQ
jgi:hypothetical protein